MFLIYEETKRYDSHDGIVCLYQGDMYIYVGVVSQAYNISIYKDFDLSLKELLHKYFSVGGIQILCYSNMDTVYEYNKCVSYIIYSSASVWFYFKGTQFLDMEEARKFYLKLCLV